jgi:hypothetical protein
MPLDVVKAVALADQEPAAVSTKAQYALDQIDYIRTYTAASAPCCQNRYAARSDSDFDRNDIRLTIVDWGIDDSRGGTNAVRSTQTANCMVHPPRLPHWPVHAMLGGPNVNKVSDNVPSISTIPPLSLNCLALTV